MSGGDDPPDPQAEATFRRSVLNRDQRRSGKHKVLWDFYRETLRLRRESPSLRFPDKERMRLTTFPEYGTMAVERWDGDDETLIVMNLSDRPAEVRVTLLGGAWRRDLDSAAGEWLGPGSTAPPVLVAHSEVTLTLAPTSAVVYSFQVEPFTHR